MVINFNSNNDEYRKSLQEAIDRAIKRMGTPGFPVDSGMLRGSTNGRRSSPIKPLESEDEALTFHKDVAAFLKAQRNDA